VAADHLTVEKDLSQKRPFRACQKILRAGVVVVLVVGVNIFLIFVFTMVWCSYKKRKARGIFCFILFWGNRTA